MADPAPRQGNGRPPPKAPPPAETRPPATSAWGQPEPSPARYTRAPGSPYDAPGQQGLPSQTRGDPRSAPSRSTAQGTVARAPTPGGAGGGGRAPAPGTLPRTPAGTLSRAAAIDAVARAPVPGTTRAPAPGGAARGPVPGGPAGGPYAVAPAQAPGAQRPRPPAGPMPAGRSVPVAVPGPAPSNRKARVVRDVHNRRLVRRLDVLSVFKVSLVFYICVFGVMLIAGTALWNVAAALGLISTVERNIRSLFALTSFQLRPFTALVWGSTIAGALCFLGALFNVFAAVVYNLISDVVGGLQIVVLDDEDA